jgi:transcriptional regulator with XRE-family HTH domain
MTKDIALFRVFGFNLRKFRNQRGLSQRDLFYLSGIDNGTICRMENGQHNVTLNTLSILAKALEVQCWELLFTPDQTSVIAEIQSSLQDDIYNKKSEPDINLSK